MYPVFTYYIPAFIDDARQWRARIPLVLCCAASLGDNTYSVDTMGKSHVDFVDLFIYCDSNVCD